MKNKIITSSVALGGLLMLFSGCQMFKIKARIENKATPAYYTKTQPLDSTNTAQIQWRTYFADPHLVALIDTALSNNQELNIMLQEIEIRKNEIRARKGEYLPFVGIGASAGIDKAGAYTRNGAVEENLEIKPGTPFPKPVPDFGVGLSASWELDIWKKLRNAKKSATLHYLSSIEGKNFMTTHLVAEISNSYFELMALDNLLRIIETNIGIQSHAFKIVKELKNAGKVSQLAVNRFEAQLLNTTNRQFEIRQKIVETENRIHFLTGKFSQPIQRDAERFKDISIDSIYVGIPSQLLANRTDIRQAELELMAAKLDVNVAKANFYPSLRITAGVGFQAFNPAFLINPSSLLYSVAGDLMAPLINRNALKATYYSANAKQLQAVYNYERSILNAYLDVVNQLSKVANYKKSYEMKVKEVDILNQSITIAGTLFNAGRADYMEVLLTQREALESTMNQIEIKLKQMDAKVNIYRALGGGWK